MKTPNLEIPLAKNRKGLYRALEIIPGVISYSMIILLVVLSALQPTLGALLMLVVLLGMVVRAISIAYRTIEGHSKMEKAQRVDWKNRLAQLENPKENYERLKDDHGKSFHWNAHIDNLGYLARAEKDFFPKPSDIYHAIIIATYNESIDVLTPTIEAVKDTTFDNSKIILVLAYEERGGPETKKTAELLREKYKDTFKDFILNEHPDGIKNEVIGKGGNITHAGRRVQKYANEHSIKYSDIIVTTLDSDNRPSKHYFDYVAYEYIVAEDRKRCSFQPISLFNNNIWDAPAISRVIAVGNSFWNVISSMRPHTLRNFASHSQPLDALVEMDFWSVRTIVEDGHQYWRSFFYFNGDYRVVPIRVPISQDAVLSDTLLKTLKAQFVQLRRWDYGASDIAYVGTRLFSDRQTRGCSFWHLFPKFVRLLDGHITLAIVAPIITIGGWLPLLFTYLLNPMSDSIVAFNLPVVVGYIQTFAMIGLFITIALSLRTLPKRPDYYGRGRHVMMLVQWILMPVTSICYTSAAAFYSQTRLMLGKYMETFDVTEKAVIKH